MAHLRDIQGVEELPGLRGLHGRRGPWNLGPGQDGVLFADRLREQWRARSLTAGWSMPGDWWSPAIEAVVDAVAAGHGLARACARLGAARGRAGVGIGETLDDLDALFGVLCWPDPPLSMVRCAAEGWVDSGLLSLAAQSCEDPLTGLTSVSYLRCRLGEIYRAAAEARTSAGEGHCLVMVDLSDGLAPWRRLARSIVVAHDLRAVFAAGETLTLVGTGRAAALVSAGPNLEPRITALRTLLPRTLAAEAGDLDELAEATGFERRVPGRGDVLIWIERLPDSLEEAMTLLDVLTR